MEKKDIVKPKHSLNNTWVVWIHKIYDKNWLKELVSAFGNNRLRNGIAMSYGKQIGDLNSNFSEIVDFSKFFGSDELIQSRPDYYCNNANAMIRKDLWIDHPFDERLTGLEDIEWSKYWMDQGYKIVYKPNGFLMFWGPMGEKSIRIMPKHDVL